MAMRIALCQSKHRMAEIYCIRWRSQDFLIWILQGAKTDLGLSLSGNADSCDALVMVILFVILVVIVIASLGGGMYQPAYRPHGIGLGTVLLIVLLLWMFGVFGHRPFHFTDRGEHEHRDFPERSR
jgi:hypothetical protein